MGCFGGGVNKDTTNPVYFGPFGEGSSTPNLDAMRLRSKIWSNMEGADQQANANTARLTGSINTAATNPGWGEAGQLAQKQIRGIYLNGSPQLQKQLDANQAAASRDAANQAADIRSGYAKNGVAFSTADQQAQQAAQAAANATAQKTNADIIAENYAKERQIQQASPDLLNTALTSPINIEGQANPALYDPLNKQAQLVTSLATGGSTTNPDVTVTQKPSAINYAQQILGLI